MTLIRPSSPAWWLAGSTMPGPWRFDQPAPHPPKPPSGDAK